MENLYLAHHGVKGMKWGVRRYQNEDGTLTAAGKKRYKEDGKGGYKKKSRYERTYEKYKTLGYSDEEAAKAAKGKIAAERTLITIGAVAATAAATYAGYRYMDDHKDRIIKPDQVMQTVHRGDTAERLAPGNPFYATYGKKDNTIYSSKVFSHFGADSSVTKFYTKDGIKVASEKSARKVFEDLVKNDPEVAAYAKRFGTTGSTKKDYLNFNYSLVLRNNSETAKILGVSDLDHDRVHKKFYDALRKKGYGGLIDVNDSKREGFTFNPVIVFDNQIKHVVSSTKATSEQLGPARYLKGLKYSTTRKMLVNPEVNPHLAAAGAIFVSGIGLNAAANNVDLNARVRYVERYREEHPNTTLTNAEIAKMYGKSKEGQNGN